MSRAAIQECDRFGGIRVTAWKQRVLEPSYQVTIGDVIYLYGCPVSVQDARTLVTQLVVDGRPDAIGAAGQIEHALQLDRVMAGLSPDQRSAVLRALADPPDGLLELRGALARDHARRSANGIPGLEGASGVPFRVILIDEDRSRTSFLVDLDDAPQSGDPVELPHGVSAVVHHVTTSRRNSLAGVIIAGPSIRA